MSESAEGVPMSDDAEKMRATSQLLKAFDVAELKALSEHLAFALAIMDSLEPGATERVQLGNLGDIDWTPEKRVAIDRWLEVMV